MLWSDRNKYQERLDAKLKAAAEWWKKNVPNKVILFAAFLAAVSFTGCNADCGHLDGKPWGCVYTANR
jgi:hypothetical protein